jgi:hypothetical protein
MEKPILDFFKIALERIDPVAALQAAQLRI